MQYRFRTKAACRIAGIDPQRFNEDVAAGEYPCAPSTTPGVSRVFDEADIAGLFVYSHLMQSYGGRFGKKIASMYACGVVEALRQSTDVKGARRDFPIYPSRGAGFERTTEDPPCFGNSHSAGIATVCFDLDRILTLVRERMAEEAQILGEED